jgi:hypothetical protein
VSNFQAFLLGIMVALTPSAIVLALLLWRAPDFDEQSSRREDLNEVHEFPIVPGNRPKNLIPDINDHEFRDAEYWHDRADEVRAMAEQMSDTDTRRAMLGIVAGYEHLARRQDSRLRQ